MSFKEKIEQAKPTTWLTDGLSDKKVARIVNRAQRRAARYIARQDRRTRRKALRLIEKAKRITGYGEE